MTTDTLASLPPAGRGLLQTLARYPVEACYLAQTARARYVLVLPSPDGFRPRRVRAFNAATLRHLHSRDLIRYVGGEVPLDFAGRQRHDSRTGERVELTDAGWALLGGRPAAAPGTKCRHCQAEIDRFGDAGPWWHVATTREVCADSVGGRRAEP